MSAFHSELKAARFIPNFTMGPRMTRLTQLRGPIKAPPAPDDMRIENLTVPGANGAPPVSLRIYRPKHLDDVVTPALFWIHGGGYLSGAPEMDERASIDFARDLGITVVSLRYRLAPSHPAPAALEDAFSGLTWLFEQADQHGIDPTRVAIGGASAGGGLAASLVLYAHDHGLKPVFQLLVYPMLDDRTVDRTDMDTKSVRMWTPGSNRYGWSAYLGEKPGGPNVSPYAAAARREDLSGLPPAWIGVGSLDLFHDEDVEYARRLVDAGVRCELFVVPGAFHGFDVFFRKTDVAREFWSEQARALRTGLRIA